MKKTCKVRGLIISVLLLGMLILTGCTQPDTTVPLDGPVFDGEKTLVAGEVLAGYSIVRPDSTGEDGVRAGIELRDGLMAVKELTLTTDWIKRGEEPPVGTAEILVGSTNRPESISLTESLRTNDFAIGQVGERIVIAGGSESATRSAVAFFIENFVDTASGQVYVPAELFTYTAEYPLDSLTVNGISIGEYRIFGGRYGEKLSADGLAAQLADRLTELTGRVVEKAGKMEEGKYIHFLFDENAGDCCSVFMDGENICVTAADNAGMTYAYAFLCQKVFGLEDLTGTGNVRDIQITEKQSFDLNSIAGQETYRIYVSPDGAEDGDGTAENPCGTIQAALGAIRYDRKLQPVEVVLKDGDYYLTESVSIDSTDAGNRYAPLTIRAENSGKVRLIGGASMDPAECVPVTDTAVLNRVIDKTAAGKLMMLDISEAVEELPDLQNANPVEIFLDGQALTWSRWPNSTDGDGYLRSEEIISASEENYRTEPATFSYTDASDRALSWSEEGMADLYILSYLGYDWYSDLLKVTQIDSGTRTMTTETGGTYLPKAGNRFFFCNLLEEIDEPGESYIDRESGIVYYYPYADNADEVFVSTLNESMLNLNGCTNVHIEGISFEYARQNPITASGVDGVTITDCDVFHIADNAMDLDGYRITVDGCEVADTWSGGIYISGGDRVNLISGENEIKNCVIHDVNRSRANYKPGVRADSIGLVVRNNTLYNSIHQMIGIHNNNVLIAYNEFYNCVTDCSDMGAIYFGRDPSQMGIEICYNYFHDIGNAYGGFGQQSIFMDDGCAGAHVHHNLFYKGTTDTSAVKFHATQFALVEHNIFADAPSAVYNGNWTYGSNGEQYYWLGWVYDLIPDRQHAIQDRIAAAGMESDLWREYYKDTQWAPLHDCINEEARQAILAGHENGAESELNVSLLQKYAPGASNILTGNVFVNIGSYDETGLMWTGGVVTDENNVPVTEDAFADYGKDFTLTDKALSEVREVIPDFENFPMDKVGPGNNG